MSLSKSIPGPLKAAFAAAALVGTLSLTGCTSTKATNLDLLQKPEKLSQLQSLEKGDSAQQILNILGIQKPEKKMTVSNEMDTIRKALYGGDIDLDATPDQIEEFRQKLERLEVWVLPYGKIDSSWRIGMMTFNTQKEGVSNKMVFIIDRETGQLAQDVKLTNRIVNEKDKDAILPSILKRTPGVGMDVLGL